MIFLVAFTLLVVTILNLRIGKSLLYPPALFSGTWTTVLFGLIMSGSRFDPVSPQTLIVFLVGTLGVSLGGIIAQAMSRKASSPKPISPERRQYIKRLLDYGIVACLIGLPFFFQKAVAYSEIANAGGFWVGIRAEQVRLSTQGPTPFSVVDNLYVLAIILALITAYEADGTRGRGVRAAIAISLALVYGALTGAKAFVAIIPMVCAIHWLKKGRISYTATVIGVSLCTVLFLVGCVFVNLYYEIDRLDTTSLISQAALLPGNYLLGSAVAFDKILTNQFLIDTRHQTLLRGFLDIARKFGAEIDLPPLHAPFIGISDFETTNTYTIYFSYIFDFGLIGTAVCLAVLGLVLTRIYGLAKRANPIATVIYGTLVYSIIFSIHSEKFLLMVNQYGKTLIVLLILYRLPMLTWHRVKVRSHRRQPYGYPA